MSYAEKLKDPRWQKKRLEILQRDNWTCQGCGEKEETLHVHHRWYDKLKTDPWRYRSNCFITLCDKCHDLEHKMRSNAEEKLLKALKVKFLGKQVWNLAYAFRSMPTSPYDSNTLGTAYAWAITSREMQKEIVERYHEESNKPFKMPEKMVKGGSRG